MRRAFTLIELLVVISIIALLIAILLPALSSARRSAQDMQGLANQQQIGRGLHVYAADNKGQLLIGSVLASYQGNYILTDKDTEKVAAMGLLIEDSGIIDPQAYYCPRQTKESFMFDTTDNPWLVSGERTRSSFSLRPFDHKNRAVRWNDDTNSTYKYKPKYVPGNEIERLPAMEDYEPDDGLVSDILQNRTAVDDHHGTGINAIRVDGSGRLVSRNLFQGALDTMIPGGFNTGNNAILQTVWEYSIKRDEPTP